MKRALLIIALLISFTAHSQDTLTFKVWVRRNWPGWSLMLVGGTSDAVVEVLRHDYPAFKRTFNLSDTYWNPAVSWRNKWKDGDPAKGEAFPGSSTVFVFTTDGYHLMRSINHGAIMAAIVIKIGHKQKWYWYAADLLSYSAFYSIGFNLTYELIRK